MFLKNTLTAAAIISATFVGTSAMAIGVNFDLQGKYASEPRLNTTVLTEQDANDPLLDIIATIQPFNSGGTNVKPNPDAMGWGAGSVGSPGTANIGVTEYMAVSFNVPVTLLDIGFGHFAGTEIVEVILNPTYPPLAGGTTLTFNSTAFGALDVFSKFTETVIQPITSFAIRTTSSSNGLDRTEEYQGIRLTDFTVDSILEVPSVPVPAMAPALGGALLLGGFALRRRKSSK